MAQAPGRCFRDSWIYRNMTIYPSMIPQAKRRGGPQSPRWPGFPTPLAAVPSTLL